jgi:hypothetical protein
MEYEFAKSKAGHALRAAKADVPISVKLRHLHTAMGAINYFPPGALKVTLLRDVFVARNKWRAKLANKQKAA